MGLVQPYRMDEFRELPAREAKAITTVKATVEEIREARHKLDAVSSSRRK